MSEQPSFIDEVAPEPEALVEGPADGAEQQPAGQGEQQPEGGKGEQQPGKEPPKPSMVPQAALHEERVARQGLERQLAEMRGSMSSMEKLFLRLTGQGEEEAAKIPAMEEDPAAHLAARLEQMQKLVDDLAKDKSTREERGKQSQAEMQALEKYATAVDTYAKANPDFNDAYAYLADSVDQELVARGFTDPVERKNVLQFEEGRLVGRMMQAGKDPAEAIYNLAKHRGYQKKEGGQGEDRLTRLAEGQEAAKTLNDAGGGQGGPMTMEQLLKLMDTDPERADAEFEKMKRRGALG